MNDPLGGVATWAIEVILALGYVGLAVLVALETIIPPIPSEVVLPLAGFLSGQGRMAFGAAVLAATTGSVIGALLFYGLGRWLGEHRLRHFVRRFGRWLLIDEQDLDKSTAWFERHGGPAVLLGRLFPAVRSYISIPAGVTRMPVALFVTYTAIGSGLWNAILIGLGWALGENWDTAGKYARPVGYASMVVLAAASLYFVAKRVRRRV